MNRLLAIGFQPAGHWMLEGDNLVLQLDRFASQVNVLYSFVCDGQIKYVGKTATSLKKRMFGYKKPSESQSTNIKNNKRIRELLGKGAAVEIFVLPDSGLMHYGQFHINMAAGLEDDIIRVISPEWNGGVKEKAEDSSEVQLLDTSESEGEHPIFQFTLQPTYFKTGFFNVGVSASPLFGSDGNTIEIYLGNQDEPIIGSINRKANSNQTPRIMGGVGLRDWFANNSSVGAIISVTVLSPLAIRLSQHDG